MKNNIVLELVSEKPFVIKDVGNNIMYPSWLCDTLRYWIEAESNLPRFDRGEVVLRRRGDGHLSIMGMWGSVDVRAFETGYAFTLVSPLPRMQTKEVLELTFQELTSLRDFVWRHLKMELQSTLEDLSPSYPASIIEIPKSIKEGPYMTPDTLRVTYDEMDGFLDEIVSEPCSVHLERMNLENDYHMSVSGVDGGKYLRLWFSLSDYVLEDV